VEVLAPAICRYQQAKHWTVTTEINLGADSCAVRVKTAALAMARCVDTALESQGLVLILRFAGLFTESQIGQF